MPLNSIPATTTVAALEVKRRVAEGQCSVDVGFWGGVVPENLGRLAELHRAGVFGFKCFMLDSGVPEFPPLSPDQLRAAMSEIAGFNGLLIVHAEDPQVIRAHARPHTTSYTEFLASRPPAAETTAIEAVIAAARETGCRTHIVHLSTAEALPALSAARRAGVPLTVETCPHYLTLAAEEVSDGQTQFKCCPPVRERANADLLWQALADGVIDFVVSDHSPSEPSLKLLDSGDFGAAWGGISSLQLGLSVVVGIPGKGRIEVGNDADFAVFAPDEGLVVDGSTLRHRHPITPYQGRELTGVIRATFQRGVRLTDGRFLGRQLVRPDTGH